MTDPIAFPKGAWAAFTDKDSCRTFQAVCERNHVPFTGAFAGAGVKLRNPEHRTKGIASIVKQLYPEETPEVYPFIFDYKGQKGEKLRLPMKNPLYDLMTASHDNLVRIRQMAQGNIRYERLRIFALYGIALNPNFDLLEMGRRLDHSEERKELLDFFKSIGRFRSTKNYNDHVNAKFDWVEIGKKRAAMANEDGEERALSNEPAQPDKKGSSDLESAKNLSISLIMSKIMLTVHKELANTSLNKEVLMPPLAAGPGMKVTIESAGRGVFWNLVHG